MEALTLYASLAAATLVSALVSLSANLRVRSIRNITVLGSYGLVVALLFVDPWWRVLTVWAIAGLVTGSICFAANRAWNRQQCLLPLEERLTTPWWLVPMGLLGWPDMLPQTIELALFDRRHFGHRRTS